MTLAAFGLALAVMVTPARGDPIPPGAVHVISGDTIEVRGRTVRLIGYSTPEAGSNARCPAERALAAAATMRLRQLIAGGGLNLRIVRCSCRHGTEGTLNCNYGRACGTLTARGHDVGAIPISEGLAQPYICGPTSCPPRVTWCL